MSSSNKQSQWVADGWEQPLQNAGLLDIDSLSDREINDSEQQTTAYVKIYANKRHLFQRIFRSAQSRIEVRNLLFIRSIGTPTPRITAWGVQRNLLGRVVCDYIITEAEADTEQLDNFVPKYCPDPKQPEQQAMRMHIARKLGEWTGKMHSEGFIHEDLKWRNILARPNGEKPDIFWIDCPKGEFYKKNQLFERKKLKDCAALDKIAHLQCSKEERNTFIQAYLGESATQQQITDMCRQVEDFRRRRFDAKDEKQRKDAKKDQ